MSFTPETLTQIYMTGVLTEEAQKTFDQWMATDPAFSQMVVQALKVHLGGAVPMKFVEARVDSQIEGIWSRNKPSFPMVLIKKYPKQLAGLAVALFLSWVIVHWGGEIQRALWEAFHLSPKHAETAPPVVAPPSLKKVVKVKRAAIPNDVSYSYVDHTLQITIDSDKKQKAAITILDRKGQIVCRVYQGPWMAGHHVITWNGKNDMGTLVPPGKYVVVVQANGQTTSSIINFPDF